MNQQEFTDRVGEQYANEFTHAEALYMALPNTDKDTFCALWLLEQKTNLGIFAELSRWLQAYNSELRSNHIFSACCRPFHECPIAYEIEEKLNTIAAAVKTAGNNISL